MALTKQENGIEVGKEQFIGLGVDPNDPEALAPLFDSLTDQYGDPINDLTREVISNAIDATVLLSDDKQNPVEITSPTEDNPYFIVEDHGVGMTPKIIEDNYTAFLASTKIMDFTQIGAHGQGAKAPLTYCTEYTVETTRDGVTTVFTLSRSTAGYTYRFVSIEENTGKKNGTKVTIPAKATDHLDFQKALYSYKKYAFDVPLIVDGVLYEVNTDYTHLTNLVIDEERKVMGRVFALKSHLFKLFSTAAQSVNYTDLTINYSLAGWLYDNPNRENRYFSGSSRDPMLVVELVPGVVDFTKSRSDIIKNEKSQALNEKILNFIATKEFADDVLKQYRGFTDIEAAAFTRGLNYNKSKLKERVVALPKFEYSFDDFTTDLGMNPFELRYDEYEIDSWGVLHYKSGSELRLYSKFDSKNNANRNWGMHVFTEVYPNYSFAGHISAVNDMVKSAVKNGTPLSSVGEVLAGFTKNNTDEELSNIKILVVNNVTTKNVSSLLTARKVLREIFGYKAIVLAEDIDSVDKTITKFNNLVNYDKVTAEEILEKVRSHRKSVSKTRNTTKVAKTYEFYYAGRFDEVVEYLKEEGNDTETLQRVKSVKFSKDEVDDDSMFIIDSYYRGGAHGIIKSLYNNNFSDNPKVYVSDSGDSMKATDFNWFLKLDKGTVYLSKSVRSSSGKAFKELKENHTRFEKYFKDSLDGLSEPDLLSAYFFPHNKSYRLFLKEYANYLISEQHRIDEAFLIMTAMDTEVKQMAMDNLTTERFNETVENNQFFRSLYRAIDETTRYSFITRSRDLSEKILGSVIRTEKKDLNDGMMNMIFEMFDEVVKKEESAMEKNQRIHYRS